MNSRTMCKPKLWVSFPFFLVLTWSSNWFLYIMTTTLDIGRLLWTEWKVAWKRLNLVVCWWALLPISPLPIKARKNEVKAKLGVLDKDPLPLQWKNPIPAGPADMVYYFFLKVSSIHLYLVSKGANWRNRDESAFRDNTVATLALERRLPRVLPER